MIKELLRDIVEGLGSKAMATALGGIVSVFMFPIVNRYFDMVPREDVVTAVTVIATIAIAVILKFWHLDVKTDGRTSTSALMLDKAAKQIALVTPEGSKVHEVAEAIDKAIPDEK